MSIADKLNYTLGTKEAIKTAIKNKGIEVSDTDSFRSYADKIEEIQTGGGDISKYFNNIIQSVTNNSMPGWIKMIKKLPITTITCEGKSATALFSRYPNIPIIKVYFTQEITSVDYMFQFFQPEELDLDIIIDNLDKINHLNSLAYMFYDCQSKTINLGNNFDTSNATNMNAMFEYCRGITNLDLSRFQTKNVTNMSYMFAYSTYLESVNLGNGFDTSSVTSMPGMFSNCPKIKTIPRLKSGKVIDITFFVNGTNNLETFGGLENLGQAYSITKSANYNNYKLDLHYSPKLTHESLINVINGLYDIATKGCNAQNLQLGATNIEKLTEEEIAIATEKGWTVS